jgi:hypothetical protein
MHLPPSIELLEPRIAPAAVFTWDGGGDDHQWTTAKNWVGDRAPVSGSALVFPGTARNEHSTNDFPAGTLFDSLTFPPAAKEGDDDSWTLDGEAVNLAHGIHSGVPRVSIGFAVTLADDQTFATEERGRNLDLTFSFLDLNGRTLFISGAGQRFQALELIDGSGSNESTIECLDETTVRLPANETVPAKLNIRGAAVTFGANPGSAVILERGSLRDFTSSGPVWARGGAIDGSSAATINGNLTMGAQSALHARAWIAIPTSLSLSVVGSVSLDSPRLSFDPDENPRNGTTIVLIDNDGSDPVVGQFADLPEGARLQISNTRITTQFRITYQGGDGNDVAIVANTPEAVISEDGKVATFTDIDGDRVTIRTDDGQLDPRSILLSQPNALGGQQLLLLDFQVARANSAGSKIVISSEQGPQGDGRVNVAAIHAYLTGIDELIVDGDVGELFASFLASLTVGSLGREIHRNSPGEPSFVDIEFVSRMVVESDVFSHVRVEVAEAIVVGGSLLGGEARDAGSLQVGSAVSIDIQGDVRGGNALHSGSIIEADPREGSVGSISIGGSLIGGKGPKSGAIIVRSDTIEKITIGGSIASGDGGDSRFSGSIISGAIGEVNVHGGVLGTKMHPVWIAATGDKDGSPGPGRNIAIKRITIDGDVRHTNIFAGDAPGLQTHQFFNADASIRRIVVKGDFRASNITAGVVSGPDGLIATSDDTLIVRQKRGTYRNDPSVSSHIGMIKILGDISGTRSEGDAFGIVAQQLGQVQIGSRVYRFDHPSDSMDLPLFLGTTGPGPMDAPSDFSIRILHATGETGAA